MSKVEWMMVVASRPDWAAKMTAFSTLATAIILLVTAIVALRQVGEARNARFAALAGDLTRRWDGILLRESRRAMIDHTAEEIRAIVERIYGGRADKKDETDYYRLQALPNFIESVAIMEDEISGLSIELVDRLWGGAIIAAWERWELSVDYVRSQPHAQRVFVNFERLAKSLEARRRAAYRGG
jgi:hypothetical protein